MKMSVSLLMACFAQTVLIDYVYASSTIKVAIVNKDAPQTDGNCKFKDSCSFADLSCRYIAHLKKQPITEAYHNDLDATVQAFTKSELDASAVVYFNENFTDSFVAKLALGSDADEETVNSAQIHVWLPQEQTALASTLKQYLETAVIDSTQKLMSSCGYAQTDIDGFSSNESFHYRYI